MRLVFSGLETPVLLEAGVARTLEVENEALFARMVSSLDSLEGSLAIEPYSLWEGDVKLKPSDALMVVLSPFRLPWDDRALIGEVVRRIERELLEDDEVRMELEGLDVALSSRLLEMGFGLNSDYGFGLEWDLKRYLKFRGFGVDLQSSESLFDNLMSFLSLVVDSGCSKVVAFVNLKTFLTKSELQALLDYVFHLDLRVLLMENKSDDSVYNHERKIAVDLQFLESER